MKKFPYTSNQLEDLYQAKKLTGPSIVRMLSNWNDHTNGLRITTDHLVMDSPNYSAPPYVQVLYTAFDGDKIIAHAAYPSSDGAHTAWMQVKAHTGKGDAVYKLLKEIVEHFQEKDEPSITSVW